MTTWEEFRKHVPNLLSTTRLVAGCAIFALYHYWGYAGLLERLVITALFATVLTDIWDGKYARKWDCKTRLGAFIDPLADKVLSWAALDILWGQMQDTAPLLVFPLLVLIALYDVSTQGTRVLDALGFSVKLVTSDTAKERTCILQATLAFFLITNVVLAVWQDPAIEGAVVAVLVVAFLATLAWTLKSGYEYFAPYFGSTATPT